MKVPLIFQKGCGKTLELRWCHKVGGWLKGREGPESRELEHRGRKAMCIGARGQAPVAGQDRRLWLGSTGFLEERGEGRAVGRGCKSLETHFHSHHHSPLMRAAG